LVAQLNMHKHMHEHVNKDARMHTKAREPHEEAQSKQSKQTQKR